MGRKDRRDRRGRADRRDIRGRRGSRGRRVHTSPIRGCFVYLPLRRWAIGATYPTIHTRGRRFRGGCTDRRGRMGP